MTESPSKPESLFKARFELAEGPLWDDRNGFLYWVDIEDKALHRLNPDAGGHRKWHFVEGITSVSLTNSDKLICTSQTGFMLINGDMSVAWRSDLVEPDLNNNRFNDAKVGPDGRLWAGSMDKTMQHASGALYCLNSRLEWTRADKDYVISNGPAFSPDGSVMYHTDSFKGEIYSFDSSVPGQISNKRVFAQFQADEGAPDGMTTDAEGCLWVCSFFAGRITRFSPAGERLMHIDLAASNVTSCAFGGRDFQSLYITTAATGMSDTGKEQAPLAGSIFQYQTGVAGLAAHRFILADHLI